MPTRPQEVPHDFLSADVIETFCNTDPIKEFTTLLRKDCEDLGFLLQDTFNSSEDSVAYVQSITMTIYHLHGIRFSILWSRLNKFESFAQKYGRYSR